MNNKNKNNKNNVTLQQKQQLAELFGISINDVSTDYEKYEDLILQLAENEWLAFNTKDHNYRYFKTETVDFYNSYIDLSDTVDMDFDLHISTDIEMHNKITKALQILNFI